jgi:hypothetical protein
MSRIIVGELTVVEDSGSALLSEISRFEFEQTISSSIVRKVHNETVYRFIENECPRVEAIVELSKAYPSLVFRYALADGQEFYYCRLRIRDGVIKSFVHGEVVTRRISSRADLLRIQTDINTGVVDCFVTTANMLNFFASSAHFSWDFETPNFRDYVTSFFVTNKVTGTGRFVGFDIERVTADRRANEETVFWVGDPVSSLELSSWLDDDGLDPQSATETSAALSF